MNTVLVHLLTEPAIAIVRFVTTQLNPIRNARFQRTFGGVVLAPQPQVYALSSRSFVDWAAVDRIHGLLSVSQTICKSA